MKKALIIFPDPWLQYSPTVLNVEYCLRLNGYEVEVLYGDIDSGFANDGLVPNGIKIQMQYQTYFAKILRILDLYKLYMYLKTRRLLKKRRSTYKNVSIVIAVDSVAYVAARAIFDNVVYLSLEVARDKFWKKTMSLGLENVITLNQEREKYLLDTNLINYPSVYYISNAPVVEDVHYIDESKQKNMLYLGNINKGYALDYFIPCLYEMPSEYSLTLKGFGINKSYMEYLEKRYRDLIHSNRLVIDLNYVPQAEIVRYVKKFYLGIAGYDPDLVERDFNKRTTQPGKLYNYLAAGIPVIASDIEAHRVVSEYCAGILLSEITPLMMAEAVDKIEKHYAKYAFGSMTAGRRFDFKGGFNKFLCDYETKMSIGS